MGGGGASPCRDRGLFQSPGGAMIASVDLAAGPEQMYTLSAALAPGEVGERAEEEAGWDAFNAVETSNIARCEGWLGSDPPADQRVGETAKDWVAHQSACAKRAGATPPARLNADPPIVGHALCAVTVALARQAQHEENECDQPPPRRLREALAHAWEGDTEEAARALESAREGRGTGTGHVRATLEEGRTGSPAKRALTAAMDRLRLEADADTARAAKAALGAHHEDAAPTGDAALDTRVGAVTDAPERARCREVAASIEREARESKAEERESARSARREAPETGRGRAIVSKRSGQHTGGEPDEDEESARAG